MFCIGIFGQQGRIQKKIRDTLLRVAFSHDMEIDTLWFDSKVALEKLKDYAQRIQIAIISIEDKYGEQVAKSIYQMNPGCLICYAAFDGGKRNFPLDSRPIAFHVWEGENGEPVDKNLLRTLHHMIAEARRINGIIHLGSKKLQISMPVRNILYFQSDLKYVIVRCVSGEEYRFFGKLSEVEERLAADGVKGVFLNIHLNP